MEVNNTTDLLCGAIYFLDFMEESKAVGGRCALPFPSTGHQKEGELLGKEGTKIFIKNFLCTCKISVS